MLVIICEPQRRVEVLTTAAILNAIIKEGAGSNGVKICRIVEVDVLFSRIVLDQLERRLKALSKFHSIN